MKATYVYFFGTLGRIKIGISRNVEQRFREIEKHTAHPLILIGYIDGSSHIERSIHAHLSSHRLKGEWFADVPEVRDCMTKILHEGFEASGIPLLPRAEPAPFVPIDYGHRPDLIPSLLRMVWPYDTLGELQAFTGEPEEVCRRWMADGTTAIPRLVHYALASIIMIWTMGGDAPSFRCRGAHE